MKSINREYQYKAINKEINDLKKQNTQTLVTPKNNKNIIKGRQVFRIKLDKDGKVDKYKVRQVTKGF